MDSELSNSYIGNNIWLGLLLVIKVIGFQLSHVSLK